MYGYSLSMYSSVQKIFRKFVPLLKFFNDWLGIVVRYQITLIIASIFKIGTQAIVAFLDYLVYNGPNMTQRN